MCRYQQLQVQALATLSSGGRSVSDVDLSSLVSFTSSSPRLDVDSSGSVSVALRSGDQQGRISVEEHVAGTSMRVAPLRVDVSEEIVRH